MVDPTTGIWHIADKDTPEHCFDVSLGAAIAQLFKRYGIYQAADLGCGLGKYVQLLELVDIDTCGWDGNPNTDKLTDGFGAVLDLSKPIDVGKFDGVISLEVGEHIPEEFEQTFIDNVTKSAGKLIVLSWAIPGQEGLGHVNNHHNDYIIEQLAMRGWHYEAGWSHWLRERADLSWFKHTIMVFIRKCNEGN